MNVFCWLGWNEHRSVIGRPAESRRADLDAVAELRARSHAEVATRRVVAERAETDDDTRVGQRGELPLEERRTHVALRRERLVVGRRALHGRGDPGVGQLESVVDRRRLGLVGEPGLVHRPEQPVAAAVAGEHAPCAIRSVRRRCEPEHDDLCVGVAEARDRATPVLLVAERCPLLDRHQFAPCDEARTRTARDHIGFQLREGSHGTRQ